MSTREKLIKARLGMLARAEELQNISLVCRRAGISRSHFYEIKEAYEKWGAEGLAPQPRRKPRMPNQTPPELEAKILEMTEQYPAYSYIRISQQLKLVGIGASPAAVRYVWQRHGLVVRYQRLLWLERKSAELGGVLTEAQMRLLRKARGRLVDPEQHIEAPHPGHLLCQDTYFVGTIKGLGKIYQQTVIDANSSHIFAKRYLSKVPMTAVDVLNDRVLPFYEEHHVEIEHLLTDNGREYCGRPVGHPFELYLAIQQIEHQRLLRTLSSHGEGRILRRGLPQNVLRITRTVAARPGGLRRVLQPRARPPRLSNPGPHAVSNLVRRGCTNAPRGGETRSCLVYNPRHRTPRCPLISS